MQTPPLYRFHTMRRATREPSAIGRIILDRLTRDQRTQTDLASAMRIPRSLLSDAIWGRRPIPVARWDDLVKALHLSEDEAYVAFIAAADDTHNRRASRPH